MKTLIDEDYKGNIIGIKNSLMIVRKLTMEFDTKITVAPCRELIPSGIILYLEKYTDQDFNSFHAIQIEACWIVSNICSVENLDLSFLLTTKILPNIISLLKSPNKDVVFNAIWALANISGDCLDFRNKILQFGGIIDTLIVLIMRLKNKQDQIYDQQALGEIIWLVSNLCRGKPYPPYEEVFIK